MSPTRRRLAPFLVIVATLAVWAPAITYNWAATWDDAVFILGNPHVRSLDWRWMATTQWYGHWMPLTWLSFNLNYALGGFHPSSWHAVNVLLHAISAVLVYSIARRLVGSVGGAVVAALLFAIHPLRMESVAWISERKDVLMGVFFLGAALLWMQGRRGWSLLVFVGACASKSPAVILPVWLIAYEWYRRPDRHGTQGDPAARLRLHETPLRMFAPFVAISAVVSVMAFWSLHAVLISVPWSLVGLGPRLLHMAYSEIFYAWQTVWPHRLSALIEYTWIPSWDQPQYPIAVALCLVGAVLVWRTRKTYPALIACAVAYTVAVLPQSGLFQNGAQLVANRYSYLACLPLALLAGGAYTVASRRWALSSFGGALGVVAGLAVVTSLALPMWKDGDAMWQYAALHEPTCTQCQDMASAADVRHGDFTAALAKQQQAIAVSATTSAPRWERHWNVGAILLLIGRNDEAVAALRTYLEGGPNYQRDPAENLDHMDRARAALVQLGAL